MSDVTIVVTDAGRAALVNAQNNGTAPVTIAAAGVSATAIAAAKTDTTLPGEIKRIATLSGAVVADDTIHLIVRDEGMDTYTVKSLALYLGDGTLFALYGQAEPILEKTAASIMLLAIDVRFADIDATELAFGDANFINPPATADAQGVVELATEAEATAGADAARAVTPKGLKAAVVSWLDARLGAGAPSDYVKGLLTSMSVVAFRAAIGLKSAGLKAEGAGNGLDADLLDGQHGAYYAPATHNHDGVYLKKQGVDVVFDVKDTTLVTSAAADGSVGVWARGYGISGTLAATERFFFGGYGDDAGVTYGFAASGATIFSAFANTNGLRIYPTYPAWGTNKLWHAGNDGAGSGLDADMLDGRQASEFALLSGAIYTGGISAPFVLASAAGLGAAILAPGTVTQAGYLAFRDSAGRQLAYVGDQNFSEPLKIQCAAGVNFLTGTGPLTRADNKIWDAGNDGAGSGLDADMLDGRQASEFALLTGATYTGAIVMSAPDKVIYSNNWASVSGVSPMRWLNNAAWSWENTSGAVLMSMTAGGALNVSAAITRAGNTVWDVGNDGAGSGLDADLLDGLDGSAYTRVVDSSLAANGGYRVHSDGYKECWGVVTVPAEGLVTVNLPVAHTSWCVPTGSGARATADEMNLGVRTVVGNPPTGFTVKNGNGEAVNFYWHTRGV